LASAKEGITLRNHFAPLAPSPLPPELAPALLVQLGKKPPKAKAQPPAKTADLVGTPLVQASTACNALLDASTIGLVLASAWHAQKTITPMDSDSQSARNVPLALIPLKGRLIAIDV